MKQRIDYDNLGKDAIKAAYGLELYLAKSSIEKHLQHLVKLRVSQINGCGFCIDMHSKDLRAEGETEQRLYLLDAWRESPFYTDRERAAFEWAEAVTLVTKGHVPDEVYEIAKAEFNEQELVDLTLVVAAINAWNRFGVSFRKTPGSYQRPTLHSHSAS